MTDPRSTYCKKWTMVDGRRRVCTFDKGHGGQCEWDDTIAEGALIRDVGPYADAGQAMKVFAQWTPPSPVSRYVKAVMLVDEAVLIGMVEVSDFERAYLHVHGLEPTMATIVAGWIIRAAHPEARLPVEPVQAPSVEGDTGD